MKFGVLLLAMRAQGQTMQADKFEKYYTAAFAGVKTPLELNEMEWQDMLTIGEWALKILEAQSAQDLTQPPKHSKYPNKPLWRNMSQS